jgi:hypothetical protein
MDEAMTSRTLSSASLLFAEPTTHRTAPLKQTCGARGTAESRSKPLVQRALGVEYSLPMTTRPQTSDVREPR